MHYKEQKPIYIIKSVILRAQSNIVKNTKISVQNDNINYISHTAFKIPAYLPMAWAFFSLDAHHCSY